MNGVWVPEALIGCVKCVLEYMSSVSDFQSDQPNHVPAIVAIHSLTSSEQLRVESNQRPAPMLA